MPACSTRSNGWRPGLRGRDPAGRPRRPRRSRTASRSGSTTRTGLVAAMLVNNEIGVIQPVAEIAAHRPRARRAVLLRRRPGLRPGRRCRSTPATWSPSPRTRSTGPRASARSGSATASRSSRCSTAAARRAACAPARLSPALCAGFGEAARLLGERRRADRDHVERLWAVARDADGRTGRSTARPSARYHGNLNLRRDGVDAARLISEVRDGRLLGRLGLRQRLGPAEPCPRRARPLRPRGARPASASASAATRPRRSCATALGLIDEAAERQLSFAA